MDKTTEQDSAHGALDALPLTELLAAMNGEDAAVPAAVGRVLPQIEAFVRAATERLRAGGRLFYIGAGTSGRLGILDASECPPTFGVPPELVVGLIAGGDGAIRQAVEGAEDDHAQGWRDLVAHGISPQDIVLGLTASGTTPFVLGALAACRAAGIATGSLACNAAAPVSALADFPIEVVVGPELVTGSTRLKAGTAQKLVLNMVSTCAMIGLGRVRGSRMVDMRLSNAKLVARGTRYVAEATGLPEADAEALLLKAGSVRAAIDAFEKNKED